MLLRVCPGSRILSFHPTLEEAQYRVLLPFLLRLVSLNEEVAVMESRRLAERVGGVGRELLAGSRPQSVSTNSHGERLPEALAMVIVWRSHNSRTAMLASATPKTSGLGPSSLTRVSHGSRFSMGRT
jgi:hypothetical protein